MKDKFRRLTVIPLIAALLLPLQTALACINLVQEPPRPDLVMTYDTLAAVLDADGNALPLQVGQRITLRLPMRSAGEIWRASIATPDNGNAIRLEQSAARRDDDGVLRQDVALKGLAQADVIVLLEHLDAPTGKKDKKTQPARQVRMLYFMVQPREVVVPPQPHPLLLGEANLGAAQHVNFGEDIIVTLAHPDPTQQKGSWRVAVSTAADDAEQAALVRSKQTIGSEEAPSDRFVLNSMALKKPLSFEFVLTPSDSFITNLLRASVAKTISFDIAVYPAPTC